MELVEKFSYDYLGKRRIELHDDHFEFEYKNLIRSQKGKTNYKDIKPYFGTGSIGGIGWGKMIFPVIAFGIVISVALTVIGRILENQTFKMFGLLIFFFTLIVALGLFLMRFIQKDCVYVYDKFDDCILYIRVNDASKDFIEEFKRRVELANKDES